MRKIRMILMVIALLGTQQIFADDVPGDKSCGSIADACLAAGFVKTESATKGIWQDCMRPVILGQTVSGVTIDPAVVKTCRVQKIKELKMELKAFQNVSSKK
jgi:hypothetical protein